MNGRKTLCALLVCVPLMLLARVTQADCATPKAPGLPPEGDSASIDEMNAAKSALDAFEKAVKAFDVCVDAEAKTKIAELGANFDAIRQVKALAVKRVTVFNDELQKHSDAYTEQMRAWKLTNRH